ncbi:hypothetical protein KC351_g281 [Hortaea werneckii]|nr:hypothetical protein KC351_g281 [Hortaea werneckii]
MAAPTLSPRRDARTPARSPRVRTTTEAVSEPPQKKRRYIPGGPGGGGRWLDEEGKETSDTIDFAKTAPRSRPSRPKREHSLKPVMEDAETPARSAVSSRPRRERIERYPPQATPRPRYSNAAAAAAASQASDGYKPREERSWEDFHPDLDLDSSMPVFTADEVDGRTAKAAALKPALTNVASSFVDGGSFNEDVDMQDGAAEGSHEEAQQLTNTPRRRPGRPPRRPESMLTGLGSPPAPRIMPLPTHNPKERLNLPKPSYRTFNHFLQYEEDLKENKVNYVDRTMSHVGYQETDRYELPTRALIRHSEGNQVDDEHEVSLRLESDGLAELSQAQAAVGKVEYDMDEQDVVWLEELNEQRRAEGVDAIKPAIFEITMTQIEKEYHALEKRIPKPQPRHAQTHRPRSSSQAAVNGDPNPPSDEPDSKCSICDDGDCENANAIIFCDGCDLAVHQECYGVPFIPEGQWFCRKCKEIGRGTPTCIFCPNVDGAFKQTNTLRWSHLLCAIWIPEVTVANMTFMEPITDVEKVPKSRWKLNCYICNQKMGACIQCGNKNCYLAFHVTCARRAKLFLKMKSQHQQGLDTSALKAFCDKHVPPEWRRTHDTDNAIVDAKRWYRHAFKDRKWADSQSAALELGAPPPPDGGLGGDIGGFEDTIAVTNKRKRNNQPPKMSWRLPSGAPVVPAVVFSSVDASLTRFTVRKRKEFVERICKYWTLKREARRGAALLKRLQLQLEGFSTMEVTRRNFAGMGAVGRPRLQRRIEFAEMLQHDMSHLTQLCAQVRERENLRLKEVELLKDLVDTVYFPVTALLHPIMQRAMKIDEKTRLFTEGFEMLSHRLRERYYTSVQEFSRDLSTEIGKVVIKYNDIQGSGDADIETIHNALNEVKPGTAEHHALSAEQKQVKALAKRLVKAVKELLEDAVRKEAQLRGREHEEALRKLDSMGIFASARSLETEESDEAGKQASKRRSNQETDAVPGAEVNDDTEMADAGENADESVIHLNVAGRAATVPVQHDQQTPASKAASCTSSSHGQATNKTSDKPTEPLSPPISTDSHGHPVPTTHAHVDEDPTDVFANGGVPWYLEPFDPEGTTVHDERYTGRAVLRDMSEELSDMDEDTLTELAVNGVEATPNGKDTPAKGGPVQPPETAQQQRKKTPARKKARSRRYR